MEATLPYILVGLMQDIHEKLDLPVMELPSKATNHPQFEMASELMEKSWNSTLEATCGSLNQGDRLLAGMAGAGKLHFAGLDDSGAEDEGSKQRSSDVWRKKKNVKEAASVILTSLALLFSTDLLEPGNGMYPQPKEVPNELLREWQATCKAVHQAIAHVLSGISCSRMEKQDILAFFHSTAQAIQLLSLESISQSFPDLSAEFLNSLCFCILTYCKGLHSEFRSVPSHSVHSMNSFVKTVGDCVTVAYQFFSKAFGTYSEVYCVAESSLHPSCQPNTADSTNSKCLPVQLTTASSSLAKVMSLLWNDVQMCNASVRKFLVKKCSSELQKREQKLLCTKLVDSIGMAKHNFCVAFSDTGIFPPRFSQQLLPNVSPSLGDPITSKQSNGALVSRYSPNSSTTEADLCKLYNRLARYDLIGVMEHARTFIDTYSESDTSVVATGTYNHLPVDLFSRSSKTDSSLAVLSSLARFMIAFFCNHRLLVPSSLNPFVLPPPDCLRHVPVSSYQELDRSLVTKAATVAVLEEKWNPSHALGLLLVCGLWQEACQFLCSLGEWKKSFMLASVCFHHCFALEQRLSSVVPVGLCLSLKSFACQIASERLLGILSLLLPSALVHLATETSSQAHRLAVPSTVEPEGIRRRELLHSIASVLYTCSCAEFDSVLLAVAGALHASLCEACRELALVVSPSFYLPAPPLYCPQPSATPEVGCRVCVCVCVYICVCVCHVFVCVNAYT